MGQVISQEIQTEECPLCHDSGWVEKEGTKMMSECQCRREKIVRARMQVIVEQSGLRGKLLEKTFENFRPATPSQQRALEVAKKGGSFYFAGLWGVGKTHLLAASVNEAIAKGVAAVFFSAPWLLQKIRDDILSDKPIGLLERAAEVEYLAIDDLGKEKPSATVLEKLWMILDEREIRGLRTSVTSNWKSDVLEEHLDGAIVSRLMGTCEFVIIKGPDHRLIKNEGR